MNRNIFLIFANHTDAGKTLFSTIITEHLEADYWKPVQSGSLLGMDSHFVQSHISNKTSHIFPEIFVFKDPLSPHQCAELEGVHINMEHFSLPTFNKHLIIESAGGILSPINQENKMIDFFHRFGGKTVLLIRHYLGSINHSLLSIEYMRQHNIPIDYLVFNGQENSYSEKVIMNHIKADTKILRISQADCVSKKWITEQAKKLRL